MPPRARRAASPKLTSMFLIDDLFGAEIGSKPSNKKRKARDVLKTAELYFRGLQFFHF
jgi:hypothetical protein